MAHFAEINNEGLVLRVVVIDNDKCLDAENNESEVVGSAFCSGIFGGGIWKQTSYNGNFRKNFAGINYRYDLELDAFIPPKTYGSWILNEDTCLWEPPISYPEDGSAYSWNENSLSWELILEVS